MGYAKNYLLEKDFANDIMAETFEEKLWKDLVALQKFQINLVRSEILSEKDLICPNCGDCKKQCDNCDWCNTSPETGL